MSRRFIVRPLAEADSENVARWYDEERPGLAERFLKDVDRSFVRLRQRPLQFPVVVGDVRRALLHTFPYAIYFRCLTSALGGTPGRKRGHRNDFITSPPERSPPLPTSAAGPASPHDGDLRAENQALDHAEIWSSARWRVKRYAASSTGSSFRPAQASHRWSGISGRC